VQSLLLNFHHVDFIDSLLFYRSQRRFPNRFMARSEVALSSEARNGISKREITFKEYPYLQWKKDPTDWCHQGWESMREIHPKKWASKNVSVPSNSERSWLADVDYVSRVIGEHKEFIWMPRCHLRNMQYWRIVRRIDNTDLEPIIRRLERFRAINTRVTRTAL